MKNLLLILLCLPLLVFAQEEKRLALVIGNANYDKGKLKNPVNDALLIAEILEKLDFEVILDTNIATRGAFVEVIEEFGDKRENYDIAFIYYAGHGVQIDGQNYLLPTKVRFDNQNHIRNKAFPVQNIMNYLTGITDKVNIFILDACRDNPFEQNWNRTRSLKGEGLAKIPPPTGSLIAFSTDAGRTAADGDGKNSIYCESLAKNMLEEDINIIQVFQKTRSDLLNAKIDQSPVENSKLINDFYLVKTDYTESLNKIWNLYEQEEYLTAAEELGRLDLNDNSRVYKLKGDIYSALNKYKEAEDAYAKSIRLDSGHVTFYNRAIMYTAMQQNDKAIEDYTTTIEIDSTYVNAFSNRALRYEEQGKYNLALEDITKAIKLNLSKTVYYSTRADIYLALKDYKKALEDFSKAIELDPDNAEYYNNRADYYSDQGENDLALDDYASVIKLESSDYSKGRAFNNRGSVYGKQGEIELEIEEYTKAIQINPKVLYYTNRALSYSALKYWIQAEEDCNEAIILDKNDPYSYMIRGEIYTEQRKYSKALKDLNKALELDPNNWEIHYTIANIFMLQEKWDQVPPHLTSAIKVTEDAKVLGVIYGARSTAYQMMNLVDKAEKDIEQSLKYDPDNQMAPISLLILYLFNGKNHEADSLCNAQISIEREYSIVSFFYALKGLIAYRLDKYDDALSHLNTSLKTNDAMSEDAWILANSTISKMYIASKKYKEAKDICKKAIEQNKENINAYYDLALIYSLEEDPYESIESLNDVIELIESGFTPPAKEDWLTNNYLTIFGATALSEIHLKRGEQWNKLEKTERACKDYQKACDLGDCEMFNKSCK